MSFKKRKAATNVVATMLIFAIMISSLGVLYSQIAPTLLGYQTTTTTANQSYIFQSIANEVQRLSSSPEGTVGRVHIVSDLTQYNVDSTRSLEVNITNNAALVQSNTVPIGDFKALVYGSFQPRGESFENRVNSEAVSVVNNTGDSLWVMKSDFRYTEGSFNMYFRAHVSVHATSATSWKISVLVLQINFLTSPLDGSPVVFPISLEEWTLRLRRQTATVNSFGFVALNGVTLDQAINQIDGPSLVFPAIANGDAVSVDIITIPILFGF